MPTIVQKTPSIRKKVLIFVHSYVNPFVDVSNQYTQLFDNKHFEVTVAYLIGEPNQAIKEKHLASHIIFINSSKRSIRGLKIAAIKKMAALHREKSFHLVICHRYKPTYIMLWVAQLHKIPWLFSVMHELHTVKSYARKGLLALLARKKVIFAGVSNAVRDDLRKTLWNIPSHRITTLYNVININLTQSQFLSKEIARIRLALPQKAFLFGNVGRLVRNKDQKTLLEAFSLIKPYCHTAKLIIMGDGPLKSELQQHIRYLQLEDDIILTGFVPDGFRFMPAFDVYVSSSSQEAFGRVLLEAMLAKLPIIATKVDGVPEVVNKAGILIEAANPGVLAEKMIMFYHMSKVVRKEWAEKSYQHVTTTFSSQQFKQSFFTLLGNK